MLFVMSSSNPSEPAETEANKQAVDQLGDLEARRGNWTKSRQAYQLAWVLPFCLDVRPVTTVTILDSPTFGPDQ